jgi:riboflavin transporter FmnP
MNAIITSQNTRLSLLTTLCLKIMQTNSLFGLAFVCAACSAALFMLFLDYNNLWPVFRLALGCLTVSVSRATTTLPR